MSQIRIKDKHLAKIFKRYFQLYLFFISITAASPIYFSHSHSGHLKSDKQLSLSNQSAQTINVMLRQWSERTLTCSQLSLIDVRG